MTAALLIPAYLLAFCAAGFICTRIEPHVRPLLLVLLGDNEPDVIALKGNRHA